MIDQLGNPAPAARDAAEYIATVFGKTTRAVLHYGSRAQGRTSRPDSAFDFFVIVDRYGDAYRALAARLSRRRVGLATVLAWFLPPNAVALRRITAEGERELKCLIISARHFARECSTRARDHFVSGRVAQRLVLAWSRDDDATTAVTANVREARERSFDWVRVFLPQRFDVPQFCRTLIGVSLAHEIRTERPDHANALFAAQRDELVALYGAVLMRLHQRGVLARDGETFVQTSPPGPVTRARVRAYFRWSKLRTSLRLLKHPFLYDGWLEYLLQKIDRSTGERIELTERERRWPLIFLWPRAFRYVRTRPQRHR